MQTELLKKFPVKKVPDRPAQTERGLQWFKTFFRLPDNPLQIPTASYQTRRNGVIKQEQYQINNPTKPHIIPLQVLNSQKGRR